MTSEHGDPSSPRRQKWRPRSAHVVGTAYLVFFLSYLLTGGVHGLHSDALMYFLCVVMVGLFVGFVMALFEVAKEKRAAPYSTWLALIFSGLQLLAGALVR